MSRKHPRQLLVFLHTALMFLISSSIGPAWPQTLGAGLPKCFAGGSAEQRLECDLAARRQAEKSQTTSLTAGWKLVKSKDLRGGADAVSVIHVADTPRSDIGLAGLSFQCRGNDFQAVLIILERFPRSARPAVLLTAGASQVELEVSVVQGGEALLLPAAASQLAAREWQSAAELGVQIKAETVSIAGVIPLQGLSAALGQLSLNCAR